MAPQLLSNKRCYCIVDIYQAVAHQYMYCRATPTLVYTSPPPPPIRSVSTGRSRLVCISAEGIMRLHDQPTVRHYTDQSIISDCISTTIQSGNTHQFFAYRMRSIGGIRSAEISPPQDELFDLLTESDQPLHQTKSRTLVHRDGDWHASIHIWLLHSKTGKLLVQQRSHNKDSHPGTSILDVSIW